MRAWEAWVQQGRIGAALLFSHNSLHTLPRTAEMEAFAPETPGFAPDSDPNGTLPAFAAGCFKCQVPLRAFDTLTKMNAWVYKHTGSKKHLS